MNKNEIFCGKETLMTVREIAEAMGVSSDTVKNCIRRIMPDKMRNGKTTYLNENEVACISRELKNNTKVIEQLTYEAGSQVKNTVTDLEVLENAIKSFSALKDLYERKEAEYKAVIAAQKPKVDYVDRYCDSTNLEEIGHLGKVTKIGEQKIFKKLLDDGYIKVRYSTDGVKFYDPCFGYERYFETIYVPFIKGDKRFSRDKLMLKHDGFMYFRKRYAA